MYIFAVRYEKLDIFISILAFLSDASVKIFLTGRKVNTIFDFGTGLLLSLTKLFAFIID